MLLVDQIVVLIDFIRIVQQTKLEQATSNDQFYAKQ